MITIAFDVDGTLIHQIGDSEDTPRYEIISMLQFFVDNGDYVYVWSGGGIDYACRWVKKLGLTGVVIIEKGILTPDVAVDDLEVQLGRVNIRV